MAYGYIRPSIRDIENPEAKLMDKVIEIIGDCFDFTDDNVQLQILKAFLTAVSSAHCDVHDRALVNAIRACFNIYLVSRNRENQTMAKGTLTQMLGIIFQRFEQAVAFAQEEKARASQEGFETVEIALETDDQEIEDIATEKKEEPKEPSGEDQEEIEEFSIEMPPTIPGQSVHVATDQVALNVAYNDCSGIFKALCKLSSKELPAS